MNSSHLWRASSRSGRKMPSQYLNATPQEAIITNMSNVKEREVFNSIYLKERILT